MNKILVVDIGGTHVKLLMKAGEHRQFDSGQDMRPPEFVSKFKETTGGWEFDQVSVGFPSVIRDNKVIKEPKHIGPGWIGFDFSKSLGKPTQVVNDAAMQALGSYDGGRMLFLGLGTGLGSALVLEGILFPLELGDLPYRDREKIENFLGIPGIDRLGEDDWKAEVLFAVKQLKLSFITDHVVLGGGNVHRFDELPHGIERGKNENAFLGGIRLWERDERGGTKWRIF